LTILKNKETVKKVDFFEDLAKISYIGDIRTYMKAEKKDKIKNAVLGSFDYYLEVYDEIIKKYNISTDNEYFQFDHQLNEELIEKLPKYFIRRFMDHLNIFDEKEFKHFFCQEFNFELRKMLLDSYLSKLNLKNSTQGIIKSLYSTDMTKSFSYMLEKYKKAFK